MKPRIWRFQKLWHCRIPSAKRQKWGIGYTPKAAFDDWKKQNEIDCRD